MPGESENLVVGLQIAGADVGRANGIDIHYTSDGERHLLRTAIRLRFTKAPNRCG